MAKKSLRSQRHGTWVGSPKVKKTDKGQHINLATGKPKAEKKISSKKYTRKELEIMAGTMLGFKPWEENARKSESLVWRKANPDAPVTMGQWFVKEKLPSKSKDPKLKKKQERNLAFLIDMFVPRTIEEGFLPAIGKVINVYRGSVKKPLKSLIDFIDVPGQRRQLRLKGAGLYDVGKPTLWSATTMQEARQYPTTSDIKELPEFRDLFTQFLGRKIKYGPKGDLLDTDLINRFRSTLGAMYVFRVPMDFIRKEAMFGKLFPTRAFYEAQPKGHLIFPHGLKPRMLHDIHPYNQPLPIGWKSTEKLLDEFYSTQSPLMR